MAAAWFGSGLVGGVVVCGGVALDERWMEWLWCDLSMGSDWCGCALDGWAEHGLKDLGFFEIDCLPWVVGILQVWV